MQAVLVAVRLIVESLLFRGMALAAGLSEMGQQDCQAYLVVIAATGASAALHAGGICFVGIGRPWGCAAPTEPGGGSSTKLHTMLHRLLYMMWGALAVHVGCTCRTCPDGGWLVTTCASGALLC